GGYPPRAALGRVGASYPVRGHKVLFTSLEKRTFGPLTIWGLRSEGGVRGCARDQGERNGHVGEVRGLERVALHRDEVGDLTDVDAGVDGCVERLLDRDRLLGVPR